MLENRETSDSEVVNPVLILIFSIMILDKPFSFSGPHLLRHVSVKKIGRGRWLTPVIPALWEAKAGRSQGQEFKTSLARMLKPHLY